MLQQRVWLDHGGGLLASELASLRHYLLLGGVLLSLGLHWLPPPMMSTTLLERETDFRLCHVRPKRSPLMVWL
jgi:hypothetical protein